MAEAPSVPAAALPVARSVAGAGSMGSGIAEAAVSAGRRVLLRDASDAAVERGLKQEKAQ
jgi:3-hydroxyacyl-CoA dehydrogenase